MAPCRMHVAAGLGWAFCKGGDGSLFANFSSKLILSISPSHDLLDSIISCIVQVRSHA